MIFRHGECQILVEDFSPVGRKTRAYIDGIARAHDDRRRRGIEKLRGLSFTRHMHVDHNAAERIFFKSVLLKKPYHIVELIYASLRDVFGRPVHIASCERHLLHILRVKRIGEIDRPLSFAIHGIADRMVHRSDG